MDISALAVLWNDAKAFFEIQREQLNALATREAQIRGCESYLLAISSPSERDVENDIIKIASKFRQAMIRDAERTFAPAGGKLAIDESDLNKILGSDRYPEKFDPVKFWNVLQDTYGGAKGEETAHRQIARTLSTQFSFKPKSGGKIVGGCVMLERSKDRRIEILQGLPDELVLQQVCHSCDAGIIAVWVIEPDLPKRL